MALRVRAVPDLAGGAVPGLGPPRLQCSGTSMQEQSWPVCDDCKAFACQAHGVVQWILQWWLASLCTAKNPL